LDVNNVASSDMIAPAILTRENVQILCVSPRFFLLVIIRRFHFGGREELIKAIVDIYLGELGVQALAEAQEI
jgi:hypothetical protein